MSDQQNSAEGGARKPNRLIKEQSPYLRQHAYNPVDWYPWGDEALRQAREENKPILLSIGYSACHWCHVMERESFENETIARFMNENFIPIKVDREERADLDQIYMDAVQLMTGRGGWPLTVFLTPDGRPFHGGTYFPPEDRYGTPGFPRVLAAIVNVYRNQPRDISLNVERMSAALAALGDRNPVDHDLRTDTALAAARALATQCDSVNGGLGGAPKFPHPFVFSLFLRMYEAEAEMNLGEIVRHTLTRMAKGGIYDQLGGGFHRYSVDDRWLVPHFEKMLYDNALVGRLYLDAGRAFGEPEFLRVARETMDYVLREMTSPEGGFYSSQDADSEGEEGKFFLWTVAEVSEVLGSELAPIAERYFDVSEAGNFEGSNILHRTVEIAGAARIFGKSTDEMEAAIGTIRAKLFAAREKRVRPGRDDKILTAWNGMMIGALAEAYRALGDERYLEAAKKALDFVMTRMWDGRALKRSYKDGVARFNAYLEDYAALANAMVDTYEASFDHRYLELAGTMVDVILERFADPDKGGFFFTSDDHEALITRSKPTFDGSTPSGNSSTVMALLRLHAYTGEESYIAAAEKTLRFLGDSIEEQPFACSHMLEVFDFYQRGATEIVLVGSHESAEMREWLGRIGKLYIPNRAIFVVDPAAPDGAFVPEPARGRIQIDGKLTAYVCRERTCSAPTTSFEGLMAELGN